MNVCHACHSYPGPTHFLIALDKEVGGAWVRADGEAQRVPSAVSTVGAVVGVVRNRERVRDGRRIRTKPDGMWINAGFSVVCAGQPVQCLRGL